MRPCRVAGRGGLFGPAAKLTPPRGGIYTSAVLLKMLLFSFDVRHMFRVVWLRPVGRRFLYYFFKPIWTE